jgi:hypothetical protein
MSWLASSELSVDRGSRGGVVFVHGTGICSDLGDIDLRSGASGHGPKCSDAQQECAEGVTQRPPFDVMIVIMVLFWASLEIARLCSWRF